MGTAARFWGYRDFGRPGRVYWKVWKHLRAKTIPVCRLLTRRAVSLKFVDWVIQKFNVNFKKSLLLSRSFECIWSGRYQQILRSFCSQNLLLAGVARKCESTGGSLASWRRCQAPASCGDASAVAGCEVTSCVPSPLPWNDADKDHKNWHAQRATSVTYKMTQVLPFWRWRQGHLLLCLPASGFHSLRSPPHVVCLTSLFSLLSFWGAVFRQDRALCTLLLPVGSVAQQWWPSPAPWGHCHR